MVEAALALLFLVVGGAWFGSARNAKQSRLGLLGQLGPAPPVPAGDRDARLRPVAPGRLRRSALSGALSAVVSVSLALTVGGSPLLVVASIVTLLLAGDVVAVLLRRRFVARYEAEVVGGPVRGSNRRHR